MSNSSHQIPDKAESISVTPSGNLTSTDVQNALQELQTDIDNFVSTDDQIASEVPFTPTGNTTSTDVQAAIEELQTEIDGISGGSSSGYELVSTVDLSLLSNPASIEFTGLSTDYKYMIDLDHVTVQTSAQGLFARLSIDNGSNYISTTDYIHALTLPRTNSNTYDSQIGAQSIIRIAGDINLSDLSSDSCTGTIHLHLGEYTVVSIDSFAGGDKSVLGSVYLNNSTAANAIEIFAETGNMGTTGKVSLYRIAK